MLVCQLPSVGNEDFMSGFEQGATIAFNAENSVSAKTDRNLKVVGDFVEYLKDHHEIVVPEEIMVGYFEQEDRSTETID